MGFTRVVAALSTAFIATAGLGCSSEADVSSAPRDARADDSSDASGTGDSNADQEIATSGWHLTTYFTALDSFYSAALQTLDGCVSADCTAPGDPNSALGDYAVDFAAAVRAEGTGKITSGSHAGEFLNWSGSQPGSGYWLDSAPRDAQGGSLISYVSSAASDGYAFGSSYTIVDCGVDSTTLAPMDPQACADFQQATFQVRDRFENNTEVKHLDLYIGLQDKADMNDNPHFVDQVQAVTTLP